MSDTAAKSPAELHAALGRMIVAFNGVEASLISLIKELITPFPPPPNSHLMGHLLTAELGTQSIEHILSAYAHNMMHSGPITLAITYAVKQTAQIRLYRNYAVHGVRHVSDWGELGWVGVIISRSAKGKLKEHPHRLTLGEIEYVIGNSVSYEAYIRAIINYIASRKSGSTDARLPEQPAPLEPFQKPGIDLRELFQPDSRPHEKGAH